MSKPDHRSGQESIRTRTDPLHRCWLCPGTCHEYHSQPPSPLTPLASLGSSAAPPPPDRRSACTFARKPPLGAMPEFFPHCFPAIAIPAPPAPAPVHAPRKVAPDPRPAHLSRPRLLGFGCGENPHHWFPDFQEAVAPPNVNRFSYFIPLPAEFRLQFLLQFNYRQTVRKL